MAESTLASFVIKLRHQIDPASHKQFTDTVSHGIGQISLFKASLVGLGIAAEQTIKHVTSNFAGLYYLSRSTGVAALSIEKLRAQFVASGQAAEGADTQIEALTKTLMDPAFAGQLTRLVGRPIRDAADAFDGLVEAYDKALRASGGREFEGQALAFRRFLEGIGVSIGPIREVTLNLDAARHAADDVIKRLHMFPGGIDEATKRAAKLQLTFHEVGRTFEYAFVKILTDRGVSEAITKIAEGIASWIIDPDNQKRLDEFLDSFSKWVANKENLDKLVTSMEALGSALGKIVSVGEWMLRHPDIAGALFGAAVGARVGGGYGAIAGAVGGALAGTYLGSGKESGAAWNQDLLDWQRNRNLGTDKRNFDEFKADWKKYHPEAPAGFQRGGIVPANLHSGEMVLPQNISQGLQALYSGGGGGGWGGGSDIQQLADRFDQWWSGDGSFRPMVDLAESTFTQLGNLLLDFFGPDGIAKGEGGGAGAGGAAGGTGGGAQGGGQGGGAGGGQGGQSGGLTLPKTTLEAISKAEGTFGKGGINYDAMLGAGLPGQISQFGKPPKPISQMNINELLQWQAHMLQTSKSSAAGAFQIVSMNIKSFLRQGIIKGTDIFNAELQGKLAGRLWKEGGSSPWEGFKAHPGLRAQAEQYARSGAFSTPAEGGAPAAGQPAVPGGGGRADTSAARGVNTDLTAAMKAAYETILPAGWTARVSSGVRGGDPGAHGQGSALDFKIFDPRGNQIPDRGEDATGFYRKAAIEGLARLMITNPALAETFSWGGHHGTEKGGGGPPDTMHVDAGFLGPRGRFGDPMAERPAAMARAAELRRQMAASQVASAPGRWQDQIGRGATPVSTGATPVSTGATPVSTGAAASTAGGRMWALGDSIAVGLAGALGRSGSSDAIGGTTPKEIYTRLHARMRDFANSDVALASGSNPQGGFTDEQAAYVQKTLQELQAVHARVTLLGVGRGVKNFQGINRRLGEMAKQFNIPFTGELAGTETGRVHPDDYRKTLDQVRGAGGRHAMGSVPRSLGGEASKHAVYNDHSTHNTYATSTEPHGIAKAQEDMRNRHAANFIRSNRVRVA